MPRLKLTAARITKIPIPEKGAVRYYDEEVIGFGFKAFSSGRRSFFVEYESPVTGRRRRMNIGQLGPFTADQARTKAKATLGLVANGEDPLEVKEELAAIPTVAQWIDSYVGEIKLTRRSWQEIKRYLEMAKDAWGSRRVDRVTRAQVLRCRREIAMRGNPTANRWLAHLAACFEEAAKQGVIAQNPVRGIDPVEENQPRNRVLSPDEMKRLIEAINDLADPCVRAAFALLIDYGTRRSEVLNARWEDIDLDLGVWKIPRPKLTTARKRVPRPKIVSLFPESVAMLRQLPRFGPYIVPGRAPMRPRYDLRNPWADLRKAARLEGVTIHDLRRSFGLRAAKAVGLFAAAKLLGHSSVKITESVYAPFGIDDRREVMKKVPRPAAKVDGNEEKVVPTRKTRGAR